MPTSCRDLSAGRTNLRERKGDTSGTPKGSTGPACLLRSCLDGGGASVIGLDGLSTGLSGTHREVGHDDTGDDNESSFEHDFSGEEPKASSRPPGQRDALGGLVIGERAQRVRFTFGDGMQQACNRDCSRPFSTFVEKDLTARHFKPSGLALKPLMDGARSAPPMDGHIRPPSSDCFPVSGSSPAVAGDRFDSECLGVPVAPPPVTGWRCHYRRRDFARSNAQGHFPHSCVWMECLLPKSLLVTG